MTDIGIERSPLAAIWAAGIPAARGDTVTSEPDGRFSSTTIALSTLNVLATRIGTRWFDPSSTMPVSESTRIQACGGGGGGGGTGLAAGALVVPTGRRTTNVPVRLMRASAGPAVASTSAAAARAARAVPSRRGIGPG